MEYVFTFLEGIASFISPCFLPMLPIYISYFAGNKEENGKKKLWNAVGFVMGFTFVFLLLAIFASTLGKLVGEYLRYIKVAFGIGIIVLGLNYMGMLRLKFLEKSRQWKANTRDLNFIKSIVLGMVFSMSWTPCIGTFLSSALLLISTEQDLWKGMALILTYSIGMGIPLIISVVLMDQLQKTFTFLKKNYQLITKLSGVILILMGIYMIFF